MKAVFIKGNSTVSVDDVKVPDLSSAGDVLMANIVWPRAGLVMSPPARL